MINKVNVTMIDGNPKIAHKHRACNLIFSLTGIQDPEELPSRIPGLIFYITPRIKSFSSCSKKLFNDEPKLRL